jgi:1-acyl-sn-glycerol-3-phosphate acyltransferase
VSRPDPSPIRPWLWNIGWVIVGIAYTLKLRLRGRGARNLPRNGAVLVVCNHLSVLDPPAVGFAASRGRRRLHYMAKAELFRRPAFAWVIGALGAYPVDRGAADRTALRMSRDLLAAGHAVLMFPEGTRSTTGRLRPGFPGAGSMALLPGVTVIPAALWGTQRTWGPARVVFGAPLDLSDIAEGPRAGRARAATERIMAAIAALVPAAGGPAQPSPVGEPSLEP